LTELTRKGAVDPIKWSQIEQNAFDTLKDALCSERILRNPDFSLPFVLQTDSSDYGLGAVLSQNFEDGEHPITFISRKLSKAELNYSTIEKECLAIIYAVKKLDYYLYGRKFKIITDHNPLKWLNIMKPDNRRLARWALCLQEYDFEIKSRPGTDNGNADGMSRL
jgi:hypothetical protein